MKRKNILSRKTKLLNYVLYLFLAYAISNTILPVNHMSYVHAQNTNIQYEYDSAGRITIVRYPDGTAIGYRYDVNGNILSSEKVTGQTLPDDKQTGNNQIGGGQTGNNQGGENQNETLPDTGKTDSNQDSVQKPPASSSSVQYTATDIKNYNQFKKSKPTIKSLKRSKKKKKYYLNIRIKQMKKRGTYGEIGYQIKYAANSKFKKAKTIKAARIKKGSITSKKWKVKKGKTYYVKVRAYMKTKKGETIYSKYSKVKKLKIKK